MALIYHKRLILKDSKVDWIAYDTEFVDCLDDGITTVTDQRGKTMSVGQSNRINYCPMCGRQLK